MWSSDIFDVLNQGFCVFVSLIGVIANAILLIAIRQRSSQAIRTYSLILANTTVVDIVASVLGVLSIARLISNTVLPITYLIYTGPCSMLGADACNLIYGLQNQLYLTSNCFLCFAFAFRRLAISGTPLTRRTVTLFSFVLHISNCYIVLSVYSMLSDSNSDMAEFVGYYPQHTRMLEAGFTLGAIHYDSPRSIATGSSIVLSSPVVFATAFFLRSRTFAALRKASSQMSAITRSGHRMFVRTLNVQLALTTFVGLGSGVYVLNFTGLLRHPLTEIAPCIIANLLPCLAPIVNLWFIKPYRAFVIETMLGHLTASSKRSDPSFTLH